MIESFSSEQVESFRRDGFLVVEEGLVPEGALERLRERYLRLFEGEYETGIRPDEVNWVPGRDPEDRTRQLCNAWKSDSLVAAQVLSESVGKLAAQLMGYSGVRILQDNVLWKPPGTKAIGFHQDSSYADYLVPPEMVTCWVSLHDTEAGAGPLEFVRGSHSWPKSPPERTQFHAPDDWLAGARAAAPGGSEPETVPAVVKAGGGSFHHGLTARLGTEHERLGRAHGARLALRARGNALPRDERRRDVLALPPPRRTLARRVVLPGRVERVRLPHALARRAALARRRMTGDSHRCMASIYPRSYTHRHVFYVWRVGYVPYHKTTVEIDTDELQRAEATLGTRGIKDTVNGALREVNRRAALESAAEYVLAGSLGLPDETELSGWREPRSA